MNKVWLVLDVSYLAWRAYHTTGKLSHNSDPTGVLYGFFRGLKVLAEQFASHQFVFCFDGGHDKRREIYPEYKCGRRYENLTDDQRAARAQMGREIGKLPAYLTACGFKNIYCQDGYEADDLIASCCKEVSKQDEVVIVSADKDLYQLLTPHVCMWDPYKKVAMTDGHFEEEWGLVPRYWIDMKALAGCKTDNIPGCGGVGDITAAKFFMDRKGDCQSTNGLSEKIWDKCCEFFHGNDFQRNLKLVTLPFPGVMRVMPAEQDGIRPVPWNRVMRKLGMKSLFNQVPNYAGFGLTRRK